MPALPSPVAHVAEHPAVNRRVVGSSPTRGALESLHIAERATNAQGTVFFWYRNWYRGGWSEGCDGVKRKRPERRRSHRVNALPGWWKAHRGGIAEGVLVGVLLAAILAIFGVVKIVAHGDGSGARTTATFMPAPPVTTPLPPDQIRDPSGHKLRTFEPDSSVEFFGGRLVVSIGSIEPLGVGEWVVSRVVLRSSRGGHCNELAGVAGSAWGIRDESGHSYRVDLRGLVKGHAGFVAYTRRSRAKDHPGPVACLELFPIPLP
jgi:hypothetical protein